MRDVRVGIVGAGFAGRMHAETARRLGARVTAVAGSTPERGAQAAESMAAARSYPTAEELVTAPDVDVVHVCTPNQSHHPLTQLALDAGKHVVCEKPVATNAADAIDLSKRAAAAGTVTAVPFVYRYYPTAWEARHQVRDGGLGPIRLVHGSYLQDWLSESADMNWRVDPAAGGASRTFADIGSHWCDLVEWVTGQRIVELIARTEILLPERNGSAGQTFAKSVRTSSSQPVHTEDAAAMIFRTEGGALGNLLVSQVSPGRKNRLWFEVDCADASVAFNQEEPEWLWSGSRTANRMLPRAADSLSSHAARLVTLPPGHPQGYADCFAAFLTDVYDAVETGGPATFPTLADGARTAVLTDTVLNSARQGRWIEVPQ